jgi:hypothetical protein
MVILLMLIFTERARSFYVLPGCKVYSMSLFTGQALARPVDD